MPVTIIELTPADWSIFMPIPVPGSYSIGVPSRSPNPEKPTPDKALFIDLEMIGAAGGSVILQVIPATMAQLPDQNYSVEAWFDSAFTPGVTDETRCFIGARCTFDFIAEPSFAGIAIIAVFGSTHLVLATLNIASSGPTILVGSPVILLLPPAPSRVGLRLTVTDVGSVVGPVVTSEYNLDGTGWVPFVSGVEDTSPEGIALLGVKGQAIIGSVHSGTSVAPGDSIWIDDIYIKQVAPVAIVAPNITGVSPLIASTAGGTPVTITGTGFAGTTSVTVGGTNVTSFFVVSDTQINAIFPAKPAGFYTIEVTNPAGADQFFDFEYQFIAPPAGADLFDDESWNPNPTFPAIIDFEDISMVTLLTESSFYPTALRTLARPGSPGTKCAACTYIKTGLNKWTVATNVNPGDDFVTAVQDVHGILVGGAIDVGGWQSTVTVVDIDTKTIWFATPTPFFIGTGSTITADYHGNLYVGLPQRFDSISVGVSGGTNYNGIITEVPVGKQTFYFDDGNPGPGNKLLDDGNGYISGPYGYGSIDYETGVWSVTLYAPAPANPTIGYTAVQSWHGVGQWYGPQANFGVNELWFYVDKPFTGEHVTPKSGGIELFSRYHVVLDASQQLTEVCIALEATVRSTLSAITAFAANEMLVELVMRVKNQTSNRHHERIVLGSTILTHPFSSGIGQWFGLRLGVSDPGGGQLTITAHVNLNDGNGFVQRFSVTTGIAIGQFTNQPAHYGYRSLATLPIQAGDVVAYPLSHNAVGGSIASSYYGPKFAVFVDDWTMTSV